MRYDVIAKRKCHYVSLEEEEKVFA